MSLFKILKGESSRISTEITPFHEGWAYFTADDGGFYIDAIVDGEGNKRILVNPKSTDFHGTLIASGWSEGRQTITVDGLSDHPNGVIAVDGDLEDDLTEEVEDADLHVYGQSGDAMTIEARGAVPTHNIPIVVVKFA